MFGLFNRLSSQPFLRRFVLPLFAKCNPGDIRIRHHYTGEPILLHSFRHKGYWFHGRRRERETMDFFSRAIRAGDHVLEVGGHIGYMTVYFSKLVGVSGRVTVFEPGSNNLPYLAPNIESLPNVELVAKAVSDEDGVAHFFEEELTGQNNSLHADYQMFAKNCEMAFSENAYEQREVETVRLDTYLTAGVVAPDLMKIDVEGAELLVLEGARQVLASQLPILVVEVTQQKQEVYALLSSLGYALYNDNGEALTSAEAIDLNVCALHPAKHAEVIERCGWKRLAAA